MWWNMFRMKKKLGKPRGLWEEKEKTTNNPWMESEWKNYMS